MYEEEDDDLPLQYRRLTAHLQTGSADFNRRLAAYITNQVAMRSAMDHMVNNSYAQQYPNAQQYPQARPNMFQSPMLPQQQMTHSPTNSYRAAPYPSPHQQNFRNMHNRAYSTAVLPTTGNSPPTPATSHHSLDQRRMSTPASLQPGASAAHIKTEGAQADPEYMRQTQSATMPTGHFPPLWQDMGPFTTSLPPESQQMLGPALDTSDPFNAMLMNGSEHYLSQSYYPWGDQSGGIKGMPVHPSAYQGMSTTLAPSALDSTADSMASTVTSSPNVSSKLDTSAPSNGLDFNFSQESKGFHLTMPHPMTRDDSHQGLGSGQVTPGEGFWDNFVQDGGWNEEATTSS